MTHQEGNKLIAEFMGGKYDKDTPFPIHPDDIWLPFHGICKKTALYYHKSWDWLIPVVERIENLDAGRGVYLVKIEGSYCSISIHDETEHCICESDLLTTKIDAVWQTVIKFIKATQNV